MLLLALLSGVLCAPPTNPPHLGPQPHRQKYWEQDRKGFVEGSPHMQKASCPRLAVRARLAHGPALLLPQRAGREQAAAEQHGQTDRHRGFVYLCPQGTGSPSLAPSRDLTLRCFWEVGNGHLVLQRGAGGLPSPHTADTGPVSPARLHWGADLAARTWHVLSTPRNPSPPQKRHRYLCQTSAALSSCGCGLPCASHICSITPPKSCRVGGGPRFFFPVF